MRRLLLPSLCLLLVGGACSPPSWQKDSLAGVAAARRGEHEQAERLITAALEDGPEQGMPRETEAELLGWLGWIQAKGEDQSRAVETFERAIVALRDTKGATNLDTQRAVRRLAQINANLGRLEEAEGGFRENLELVSATAALGSPARIGAINDMAFILAKRGKLDEAKEFIDQGFEILDRYRPKDTDARGTLTLIAANLMTLRSEFEESERLYRGAIEMYDGNPSRAIYLADAYAGLADALAGQGKGEEAETAFRKALAALGDPTPQNQRMRERIEARYESVASRR